MPDAWELVNGLNPRDPSDGPFHLERYLDSLAAPAFGGETVLDDNFADGDSQNQDLAKNSVWLLNGRTNNIRTDAPGSVTIDMTPAGASSEAVWAFFTERDSPVRLEVGDKLTVEATFSLDGFRANGQDIRWGVFDSLGTRNTGNLSGGQNDATFAGDPGYGLQFCPSGSGAPFVLARRTALAGANVFNNFGDFTPLPGSGSSALNIPAVSLADAGAYAVLVSNSSGSVLSAPAVLSVVSAMYAVSISPWDGFKDLCPDSPLAIEFNEPPRAGRSGRIRIYNSAGAVMIRDTELRTVSSGGYIVQARNGQGQNGYVFVNCRLTAPDGVSGVYLARIDPNVFPFSHVVWIHTSMGPHIHPAGWLLNNADWAPSVQFWEHGSTDPSGAPLDVSRRAAFSRQLTADEAARWSDPNFVFGWSPTER